MNTEEGGRQSRGRWPKALALLAAITSLVLASSLWGDVAPSYGAVTVDTLDYFLPAGSVRVVTEQNPFYGFQADTVRGRAGFYYAKSWDSRDWEEFNYDGSFIYHLKDTSWATGFNQNVHCTGPGGLAGNEAYFSMLDSSRENIQASNPAEAWQKYSHLEGAKWAPRQMTAGADYSYSAWVIGFSESACQYCDAPYTGPGGGHTVRLVSRGPMTFPTGWHHDDMICIAVVGGAGYDPNTNTGENFYYARGIGWVGFDYRSPAAGDNVVGHNYPIRVETGSIGINHACYGGGAPAPTSTPTPPQGPSGSLTGGRVLDGQGRETSPPANTRRNDTPVQPGQTRQAEEYWGLKGIDYGGTRAGACDGNRNAIYIAGWHQNDLAEYRVNFPDASKTYRLNVIGQPDGPKPVEVDVFVDGNRVGQIKWNDSNPRCNEGQGGSSQTIDLSAYQGVHAVAFVFANDFCDCGGGWSEARDRNFWFDYFKFDQVGGGSPPPTQPPSSGRTSKLHGTVLRSDGTREANMYVSVWRQDGGQFLTTYTNSQGVYGFSGLDPNQKFNLVVNARWVGGGGDCGGFDRIDKSRNSAVRNNVELIAGPDNWHGEDFWLTTVCP
jgi:hypothetical protein